jgi:hypothetical protein
VPYEQLQIWLENTHIASLLLAWKNMGSECSHTGTINCIITKQIGPIILLVFILHEEKFVDKSWTSYTLLIVLIVLRNHLSTQKKTRPHAMCLPKSQRACRLAESVFFCIYCWKTTFPFKGRLPHPWLGVPLDGTPQLPQMIIIPLFTIRRICVVSKV